nr:Kazal-type serine protease inhibitor [Bacteriovorax sp. HI3]
MIRNLVLASMVLALTACTTPSQSTSPKAEETTLAAAPVAKSSEKKSDKSAPSMKNKAKECICTKLWMPVCGENNKTYGNACEADCAGVKYTEGACKDKLQDV